VFERTNIVYNNKTDRPILFRVIFVIAYIYPFCFIFGVFVHGCVHPTNVRNKSMFK